MKLTGTAWKFQQDNISTGRIRAKTYSHLSFAEQGRHCLEDIDAGLAARAKPGGFIVAGRNFGAGSSIAAHGAVVGLGIAAELAESFGRLFLSNCVSAGLWAITCPGILALAERGERLEIDLDTWQLRNLANGMTVAAMPLPEFFREMTAAAGEKSYLKARIPRERSGAADRLRS